MPFGKGSLRSRAASLLRASTPSATNSIGCSANQEKGSDLTPNPATGLPLNEKVKAEEEPNGLGSSNGGTYHSSGSNAVANDRAAHRIVRAIPSWVHTFDDNDEGLLVAAHSLSSPPAGSELYAQHDGTPAAAHCQHSGPSRGHIYDHGLESIPPLNRNEARESGSRWKAFVSSSAYPTIAADGGHIVTEEWLRQNGPDYSRPWLADVGNGDPEKDPAGLYRFRAKRRAWYIRAQRTVLRNPIVPMVIRMNVWSFSAVALALACSIHHITDKDKDKSGIRATPSANMAIVVDAVALVYLLYITYDEYSGKPLGLRPAKAKMRLIFLDLFFIVFDSANLSLAFETIQGDCHVKVCTQQKALASVLLIALIAWLLTFSISVMRLVERVTTR